MSPGTTALDAGQPQVTSVGIQALTWLTLTNRTLDQKSHTGWVHQCLDTKCNNRKTWTNCWAGNISSTSTCTPVGVVRWLKKLYKSTSYNHYNDICCIVSQCNSGSYRSQCIHVCTIRQYDGRLLAKGNSVNDLGKAWSTNSVCRSDTNELSCDLVGTVRWNTWNCAYAACWISNSSNNCSLQKNLPLT